MVPKIISSLSYVRLSEFDLIRRISRFLISLARLPSPRDSADVMRSNALDRDCSGSISDRGSSLKDLAMDRNKRIDRTSNRLRALSRNKAFDESRQNTHAVTCSSCWIIPRALPVKTLVTRPWKRAEQIIRTVGQMHGSALRNRARACIFFVRESRRPR